MPHHLFLSATGALKHSCSGVTREPPPRENQVTYTQKARQCVWKGPSSPQNTLCSEVFWGHLSWKQLVHRSRDKNPEVGLHAPQQRHKKQTNKQKQLLCITASRGLSMLGEHSTTEPHSGLRSIFIFFKQSLSTQPRFVSFLSPLPRCSVCAPMPTSEAVLKHQSNHTTLLLRPVGSYSPHTHTQREGVRGRGR